MPASLHFSRQTRARIYFATGALSLALWLFMAAVEICPPLHSWLHGGSVPDDDDCVVVAIALGHFDSATPEVPTVMPAHWIQIEPLVEISVFVPANKNLPNERAPPVFSAAS